MIHTFAEDLATARSSHHQEIDPDDNELIRLADGRVVLNTENYDVGVDGRPCELGVTEFTFLAFVGRQAGRLVTYDVLNTEIWDNDHTYGTELVRKTASNIRKKIAECDQGNPKILSHPKYGVLVTRQRLGYQAAEKLLKPDE